MPRQNRPQWHAARRCWKFTFQKKTEYFGRDIPQDERPQIDKIPARAWEQMNEIIRRLSAKVIDSANPTVYGVAQLYLQWAEGEVGKDRMAPANYRAHCTHLEKFWSFRDYSERPAREMVTSDLAAFCRAMTETDTERKKPHSPQYIANICKSVQAAFNWAAERDPDRTPPRLIAENPLKGFRPGPIPHQERYVEPAVARRFLRWAWGRARRKTREKHRGHERPFQRFDRLTVLMLQFLRLTGARPGEACALQWDDIHWKDEIAVIPHERHKTGKRTGRPRIIHITPPVARLLRTIGRLEGHHPVHVFTHKLGRGGLERGAESMEGEPWNSVALSNKVATWRKTAVKEGLPLQETGEKRFVNYILRHSYATDAIQSGLTHAEAADLIGNTAQVTEQRYSHIQRKHSAARARHAIRRGRGER